MFIVTDGKVLLQLYASVPNELKTDNSISEIDDNVASILSSVMASGNQVCLDAADNYSLLDEKARFYAQYVTRGARKYIIGVEQLCEGKSFDATEFIPISEQIYHQLETETVSFSGFFVKYNTPVITFSCDIEKVSANVEQTYSELDTYRDSILADLTDFIDARISKLDALFLFRYFKLNQDLAEKGFLITDKNRQEKYIDIINTGEEDAISTLTEYSEIYESLLQESHVLDIYNSARAKILASFSKAEIDAHYAKTIDMFG